MGIAFISLTKEHSNCQLICTLNYKQDIYIGIRA